MPSDPERLAPESIEQRQVEESLRLLDETASSFRWNTIVTIIVLFAALVALSAPPLAERYTHLWPLEAQLGVRGLIVLLILTNVYSLYHQRQLKDFRRHHAEQMQVTVKHRLRADKFYGLSILDPLTGLYNRRFGEECLYKEIQRAENKSLELAVIVLDLDKFKHINDEFGHAAGDLVLQELSRLLRRAIRACDVPVRIGGDEFLVVLPECPRENVHTILSRLRPVEVMVDRLRVAVSYSVGHAQYQVGDTPQSIIQRADKVLYVEKAARSVPVSVGQMEDAD